MMRIITGRARGTKLSAPKGETTRPTAERTKEAIFSILQFDLAGREVLELFAGSGQMSLEALSRGAASALLCDASREAAAVIRENAAKTRLLPLCEILCCDWRSLLQSQRRKRSFDLVFLDPPYAKGLLPEVLQTLLAFRLLKSGAKLICETAEADDVFAGDAALSSHFEVLRVSRYGAACVTILQTKEEEVPL